MTQNVDHSLLSSSEDFFDRYLAPAPIMVILRGFTPDRALELSLRAWGMGIDLVEIPLQGAESLAALRTVTEAASKAGRRAGAGTIVSVELVEQAARAGAAFTVAPGWDDAVAVASLAAGMPHLPGVATATEVQRVLDRGLRWQKLFPAREIGAPWIAALHGPFPGAKFVATGGIGVGNAVEFRAAGAAAVSLGSSFADADPTAVRSLLAGAEPN